MAQILPPEVCGLTLNQVLRSRGAGLFWPITVQELYEAWHLLSDYLLAQFPIISEIIDLLNSLDEALNEAESLYLELKQVYNEAVKVVNAASAILTGNPTAIQKAESDAQKQATQTIISEIETQFATLWNNFLGNKTLSDLGFPGCS